MEYRDKEVFFNEYCHKCKHKDLEETKDPCNECLTDTVNEHSHKPTKFEEEK